MLNRNCRSVEQMSTLYEISHNLSAGRHNLICGEIYPTLEVSSARYHGSCENYRASLLELKAVVRKTDSPHLHSPTMLGVGVVSSPRMIINSRVYSANAGRIISCSCKQVKLVFLPPSCLDEREVSMEASSSLQALSFSLPSPQSLKSRRPKSRRNQM